MANNSQRDGPKIPTWNGDVLKWPQYETDVEWTLSGTPHNKRAFLVGRLVQALPEQRAVRTLVQSWKATEFENEDGVRLYLDRLRASPLMKKPLPQASLAMTRYFGYRRFLGQTMGEYLIGEEKMFSDYKRALERLKEQAISAGRLKRRWSAAEWRKWLARA